MLLQICYDHRCHVAMQYFNKQTLCSEHKNSINIERLNWNIIKIWDYTSNSKKYFPVMYWKIWSDYPSVKDIYLGFYMTINDQLSIIWEKYYPSRKKIPQTTTSILKWISRSFSVKDSYCKFTTELAAAWTKWSLQHF